MRSLIQSQHRHALEHDGVVHIREALSPETVQFLFEDFKEHIGPHPEENAYGVLRNNVWRARPAFEDCLRHSILPTLAMDLLHCDEVLCFQDNVICKVPNTLDAVAWHQDYSYWPLSAPLGITLWVALTEATRTNGCMWFAPASHRLGERCPTNFIPHSNQPLNLNLPLLDIKEAPNPPRPFPAEPGDIIAHNPLVWHQSPANPTTLWRCAWSITFLRAEVSWNPDHAPHPYNHTLNPTKGAPIQPPFFPRFQREVHSEKRRT